MTAAVMPPQPVVDYVTVLARDVQSVAGVDMLGVYLHGSAALGGWNERISDVDVLVVVKTAGGWIPAAERVILTGLSRCPGTGLELSIVTLEDANDRMGRWPFVLHIVGSGNAARVVRGSEVDGDSDLVLHYAVCRVAAHTIAGPPAGRLIRLIPRPVVLLALADELEWGLANGSPPYALLNACRALALLHQDVWLSKCDGGRWALRQQLGPAEAIQTALATQQGDGHGADANTATVCFVHEVIDNLRQLSTAEPHTEHHNPARRLPPR